MSTVRHLATDLCRNRNSWRAADPAIRPQLISLRAGKHVVHTAHVRGSSVTSRRWLKIAPPVPWRRGTSYSDWPTTRLRCNVIMRVDKTFRGSCFTASIITRHTVAHKTLLPNCKILPLELSVQIRLLLRLLSLKDQLCSGSSQQLRQEIKQQISYVP